MLVNIVPFGDHVIPVVFELEDDNKIIEPMEFYHLTIVNISDPSAVAGDVNTTYIIVHDDDDSGKVVIESEADCTHIIIQRHFKMCRWYNS